MRNLWLGSLPVIALAVSGCAPPIHDDLAEGTAWTSWQGPWVVMADRCGFCVTSESSGEPNQVLTAVDAAGHAIRIDYGGGGQERTTFRNGTSPAWSPVIEPLLATSDPGGHLLVFRIRTATVAPADWTATQAALEDGLANAREPVHKPGPTLADGPSTDLYANGARATIDYNLEDGGWHAVKDQMDVLKGWLA